jgi:hypothetical protein
MSEASIGAKIGGERVRGTLGREGGDAAAGLARHLSLAAAPTFAIMALLEGAFGVGLSDTLCVATPRVLPLNGMVVMYALMSVFHAAPWLKAGTRMGRVQSGL